MRRAATALGVRSRSRKHASGANAKLSRTAKANGFKTSAASDIAAMIARMRKVTTTGWSIGDLRRLATRALPYNGPGSRAVANRLSVDF